ncbi:hypothetical protein [Brachybacterium atlanticum]|uniref:hypothetical protein n=1 Tax=Brachybacterium atlanticum TaxID=2911888 RepID=UPI0021E0A7D1|nr:hypothetical protein [Brachybacterium atlanticum]
MVLTAAAAGIVVLLGTLLTRSLAPAQQTATLLPTEWLVGLRAQPSAGSDGLLGRSAHRPRSRDRV